MSAGEGQGERDARDSWSDAHGGVDPDGSVWVSGWLRLVHRLTRPLVGRGIPPAWVTIAGVAVSGLVPLLTWWGDGWLLGAGVLVLLAGLLDGVDGALARADGSATPWGSVVDDLADRCSDLLLLVALVLLGAPVWWCVAAGAMTLLLESTRASARAAGLSGIGTLTVWERPSRLIVTALATGLAGTGWALSGMVAGVDDWTSWIASTAAGVATVLAATGLLHLALRVRSDLLATEVRPDPPSR